MEWFRRERNPWGQEILVGLSWDLIWLAVAAGVLFIAGHAIVYYWRWPTPARPETPSGESLSANLPEYILRHSLPSRIFHWVMAFSVLTLLFTAFLPVFGLKFSWVTAHWIAGFILTGAIIFHIVHASFWKGLSLMWITAEELRDGWLSVRQILGLAGPSPRKPGKNPLENKLFHHAVALSAGAAVVTGLVMMAKVDTPWWDRNPYILSDGTWGIIYVIHGAGSVALIALVMAHLYFALRPEKRWITLSMISGWISRERYLEHHDPERWPVAAPWAAAQAFLQGREEKPQEAGAP